MLFTPHSPPVPPTIPAPPGLPRHGLWVCPGRVRLALDLFMQQRVSRGVRSCCGHIRTFFLFKTSIYFLRVTILMVLMVENVRSMKGTVLTRRTVQSAERIRVRDHPHRRPLSEPSSLCRTKATTCRHCFFLGVVVWSSHEGLSSL